MKDVRWMPFKYSSSGWRLHASALARKDDDGAAHLEVMTQTTPKPINRSSNPRNSIAVTMSVT